MMRQLLIVSFSLFIATASVAQIDEKVYTINGEKYYLHTVERGHTLYGISKKYSVEIQDLIDANPGVEGWRTESRPATQDSAGNGSQKSH